MGGLVFGSAENYLCNFLYHGINDDWRMDHGYFSWESTLYRPDVKRASS